MSVPRVVPAHVWRRQTWRSLANIVPPVPEIWVHHGAVGTPTLTTLLAYEHYHVRTLGWRAIGYSWAVAEPFVDGWATVYECRGWGKAGGHTSGHNLVSHGILLTGDWTSHTVPTPMVRSTAWLVREGHSRGASRLVITGGHRQAPRSISTSCPGTAGMAAIPKARALLAEVKPPPEPEEDEVDPIICQKGDSSHVVRFVRQRLEAAGFAPAGPPDRPNDYTGQTANRVADLRNAAFAGSSHSGDEFRVSDSMALQGALLNQHRVEDPHGGGSGITAAQAADIAEQTFLDRILGKMRVRV